MLINKNTKITGSKVVLIPYRSHHVPKYHLWMQSPELLRLTGSERLTMEQEYEMQRSWLRDSSKCTFIVLDREKYEETGSDIESMIGDTNLYFMDSEATIVAEAEIMIAEEWARGRHCGIEAMSLMMWYGLEYLHVKHYVVRILDDNKASIKLFEKLGFVETGRSEVFKEVTMEKVVDDGFVTMLKSICGYIEMSVYESVERSSEEQGKSNVKIHYVDE